MQSKLTTATMDVELMMQVLSCGDGDLAEFLRHSTDPNGSSMAAQQSTVAFPGPLDPSSILAEELAFGALREGAQLDLRRLL